MNKDKATKIITAGVKAMLVRGDPPTCLLDDYIRVALMVHHLAIERFLPNNPDTIYNNYVIHIDFSSMQELKGFI